ncbi:MAG: Uncharacterized protein FD157_4041 [Rhodocyclaceae bacterium]|nr:MAG: Uncharacterized protein FD157_4041 [Rhodocyclaceae bacterium]TNC98523.1 MAG: Uncharacterized protein FD118_4027 [Rhodocyclaceae bacterium]
MKIVRADQSLPGISVVIPIFNAGKFLEKTLRSLLCNDLTGCEIIVMDGGSTDGTPQILEHYKHMFSVCVSERDDGQSDAINRGFARATQPILYWLNGDDLVLPNVFTAVRKYYADQPGVNVLVGNAFMTELDLTPIRHFVFSPEKLRFESLIDYASNHLIQPSVFFSREAWEKSGPVKKELHYAMDADLFIDMSKNFSFHHFASDLAYSVYHEECKTRGKRAESITELALIQARHGGFQQAKKTLDILVGLYHQVETSLQSSGSDEMCRKCSVLEGKLSALTAEYNQNVELALLADIEIK